MYKSVNSFWLGPLEILVKRFRFVFSKFCYRNKIPPRTEKLQIQVVIFPQILLSGVFNTAHIFSLIIHAFGASIAKASSPISVVWVGIRLRLYLALDSYFWQSLLVRPLNKNIPFFRLVVINFTIPDLLYSCGNTCLYGAFFYVLNTCRVVGFYLLSIFKITDFITVTAIALWIR